LHRGRGWKGNVRDKVNGGIGVSFRRSNRLAFGLINEGNRMGYKGGPA